MFVVVVIALVLVLMFLYSTLRFGKPRSGSAHVLCFHKVSRRFCWEGTWTTPQRFAATIDHLADRGYRFVTLADYLREVDTPSTDSDRVLLLTFDDGYAEVYSDVFPMLTEKGIPFHVFVVSEFAGRDNAWDLTLGRRAFRHLDWEEIRTMAGAGVGFGSHSATHRDLTRLSDADLRSELESSRRTIAEHAGIEVDTISYPFGRCNARVAAAARSAGYTAGFSLYPRRHNLIVDRYALRRNAVYIIDPPALIECKFPSHPFFLFEELKCRVINAVAVLTPVFKRHGQPADRDR